MHKVLRIDGLPPAALDAAGAFHREHLPLIRQAIVQGCGSLTVLLSAAPYDHTGWRRAAVQDLARAHVPVRVNFVAGDDRVAMERTAQWLAQAAGITGQLLQTD